MPPTTAASTSSLAASPCVFGLLCTIQVLTGTQEPSRNPPAASHNSVKLKKEKGQPHLPPISRAATERIAEDGTTSVLGQ